MKSQIRHNILKLRNEISVAERKLFSTQIRARLEKLPEYQKAQTVLLYHSFGSEVETLAIIRHSLLNKKNVLLPVSLKEKNNLEARQITNLTTDLQEGAYEIFEPKKHCAVFSPEKIDLVIVPGVVFSPLGGRIGYGKGYYDRFLHSYNRSIIGLAFEKQINHNIILEKHDVKVSKIITETKVVDCTTK